MALDPENSAMVLGGFWLVCPQQGKDSSQPPVDNCKDWQEINLPCAWQTVLGTDFHGIAWFKKTVILPEAWHKLDSSQRLWIRFQAVATDIEVWINGLSIGKHIGDYVPFQFEIPQAIRNGSSLELLLRVDEIAAEKVKEGELQTGHITKGFHDVISMQHGGVWQDLCLLRTGPICSISNGVKIKANPTNGEVKLDLELESPNEIEQGSLTLRILDHEGNNLVQVESDIQATSLFIGDPVLWSPNNPYLYTAEVDLLHNKQISETHRIKFGFRSIETRGSQILLNGSPIFLRGILHWGHEPKHIAPSPTPAEVRDQFQHLLEMGFNTVCLCMWYPPEYFFDIADEMGMLIWQEHPVWQSQMGSEYHAEYKRLFEAFMRMDRNHTSVIIVSATCEHPCFDKNLADWWWGTAKKKLPNQLHQVQTANFKLSDPDQTDLHDEHTYDNSGRWVFYLKDLQQTLAKLPEKPFVMGETVLFTSWPDTESITKRVAGKLPWWQAGGFEHKQELTSAWEKQYGKEVIERFIRQGDRHHLIGRKFQMEQFRFYPNHSGLVMNHLRDVPQLQCGLMDDLDRWRFTAEDCRGWLCDVTILLHTPNHRRGFCSAKEQVIVCDIAVSNFSSNIIDQPVLITIESEANYVAEFDTKAICCKPGEIIAESIRLQLPDVNKPTCVRVTARLESVAKNHWDLWAFPGIEGQRLKNIVRLDGFPFTEKDNELDELERGYSRGFGLRATSWESILPDPASIAPHLPAWNHHEPLPGDTQVVLTHRLTNKLLTFMESGGRVVLLASKAEGGIGTRYEWLFGQVPLIIEQGPIDIGDSEWIVDLLGYDLTRRYARIIPVEDLGLVDKIDPLIRLVYTHNQTKRVQFFDQLFLTRVGSGLLVVSSLDHTETAGQWLLKKLLCQEFSQYENAASRIDPAQLSKYMLI
ncbi:MAG: hypothetical protein IH984_17165 [Planctomycetes bacterium]|nr:hypothetical protein [Planctomycetota bacterium]